MLLVNLATYIYFLFNFIKKLISFLFIILKTTIIKLNITINIFIQFKKITFYILFILKFLDRHVPLVHPSTRPFLRIHRLPFLPLIWRSPLPCVGLHSYQPPLSPPPCVICDVFLSGQCSSSNIRAGSPCMQPGLLLSSVNLENCLHMRQPWFFGPSPNTAMIWPSTDIVPACLIVGTDQVKMSHKPCFLKVFSPMDPFWHPHFLNPNGFWFLYFFYRGEMGQMTRISTVLDHCHTSCRLPGFSTFALPDLKSLCPWLKGWIFQFPPCHLSPRVSWLGFFPRCFSA